LGNRAVITFGTATASPCIYLHWNGGRASVEGFLSAVKALRINPPDPKWGMIDEARFFEQMARVVGPWFFGNDPGFTIYLEEYGGADKDNYDNGVYVLSKDTLEIVGRKYKGQIEELNSEKTAAIRDQILARAPIFND
jgi:hypothetical protein